MILHILPENGRKRGCSRPWHVFHPVVFVGPHFVWLKLSQWRLLLVQMCSELVVVLLAENLFPGSKTSKQIRTQDGWQNAARNLRITCSAASATWARFPKLTIQCAHYQHICIVLDMFMWCPRQLWGKGTRDDSWMLSLGQQAPPRNETPLLPPPRKRWVTSKKEDDEQEEDEDENKVEDENEDDNPGPS